MRPFAFLLALLLALAGLPSGQPDRLVAADYPGADDFAYTYDAVGNVTAITTPAESLTFTYDLADRITSAGPGPSPAAPVYDANGNLTGDGSYGGRTYSYDPLGRLVGVSGAGHSATYELDGAGNRLAQTLDSVSTSFDLDLSVANPTILADGSRVYLPADPGAGSLSGGTWTSTLVDHLGTSLLTVSEAGSVGSARAVGPYGLARDGSTLAAGIGYTGEWSDASGLVNLRARAYDPLFARFVGRDTFGGVASAPLTANRSSYALNNPFRYTDPSGRFIQAAIDHPGELASFALSLTVVPGLALAAWGAVTGTDPFTGRALSESERSLGFVLAAAIPLGGLAAKVLARVAGPAMRGLAGLPGRIAGRLAGRLDVLGDALRALRGGVLGGSRASQAGELRLGVLDDVVGAITTRLARGSSAATLPARGWKVGDPINSLTKAGNDPAWSTVRARYWKNVANDALDGEYSAANLVRMRAGKPPLHEELGVPMELNHIIPRSQGGTHTLENLEPLWPWEHAAVDPYRFYEGPTP
jgi:RHS repeat-associated protein